MSARASRARPDAPRWSREGRGWPLGTYSRFVRAAGLTWHVQRLGEGPACLLLHGAGAASHAWRLIAPRLASRFTVLVPDLPGHGFSDFPEDRHLGLENLARSVGAVLEAEGVEPELVIGHSAGGAILARAILDGGLRPRLFVGLNPALWPIPGMGGRAFSLAARLMSQTLLAPQLVARRARDPEAIRRIVAQTGSEIDAHGLQLYGRLAQSAGHVAGTIQMLASWDLEGLASRLEGSPTRTLFIVGAKDRAVPPGRALALARRMPAARAVMIEGAGHLLNEEAPAQVVEHVERAFTMSAA